MLIQTEGGARVSRGVSVDLKVGESVTLTRDGEPPIKVTIEEKSGQRSRVRIQAADDVRIGRPEKKTPAFG
jgi:hypothetical protein